MPGMMSTILNLGLTAESTAGPAAETGDPRFALDTRLRFLSGFARAVYGLDPDSLPAVTGGGAERHAGTEETRLADAIGGVEALIRERAGGPVPDDAMRQLELAVMAVFSSWDTPRATTYRTLHGIPNEHGTAVTVQAMVFGNRDGHSGTGVAFSRDPNTGERAPFGEVLFGRQGEDVVSGTSMTLPLPELAEREPAVWAGLLEAMHRVEEHNRDACHVEFKGPPPRSRASRTATFRPWWWRSRAQVRPASPAPTTIASAEGGGWSDMCLLRWVGSCPGARAIQRSRLAL